jgi:hypothetical protein
MTKALLRRQHVCGWQRSVYWCGTLPCDFVLECLTVSFEVVVLDILANGGP